jgi:AraC family transcriptional regulator
MLSEGTLSDVVESDLANLAKPTGAPAYVAQVNRVIDHIMRHLDRAHPLDDIARIAGFSPYHFHRIFKSLTGETLAVFVKRLRLERALYLLSHRDRPRLTDVALACGFASSAEFSRSFKARYGVAPRAFDLDAFRREKRHRMQTELTPTDRHLLAGLPAGENPDGFVAQVRPLAARTIAYIRVARPFEEGNVTGAAERLIAWAQHRGLADGQWLGYMWDDPEIVALADCRYDVGVEVPDSTQVHGEVCRIDLPAMQVAEIAIAGPIDLEQRAIDWMYRTWLPQSGYVPDHQPVFEAWEGLPFAHGHTHFELRMQLPVVPASTPL